VSAILYDTLGPIGRRRVAIGSAVAIAGLAVVGGLAVIRLVDAGQFQWQKWSPILNPADAQFATLWRFLAGGALHTLEAAAFAYPAMVILSITYGFLQNVGFPQVNWMFAGVDLMILYGLGQLLSWWRYR